MDLQRTKPCRMCGELVPYNERGEPISKYWHVAETGEIEPYCSPECGLKDYEDRHRNL